MLSRNLHINYHITFALLSYEAFIAAASTHKSPAASNPVSSAFAMQLLNVTRDILETEIPSAT
jgi:hypothetical protein